MENQLYCNFVLHKDYEEQKLSSQLNIKLVIQNGLAYMSSAPAAPAVKLLFATKLDTITSWLID